MPSYNHPNLALKRGWLAPLTFVSFLYPDEHIQQGY